MSNYQADYRDNFRKHLKVLKNNHELVLRLEKKTLEILKNPYHFKPLRNVLKNRRRTHLGSFVLIFEIIEKEKTVVFHAFQHHDEVYT